MKTSFVRVHKAMNVIQPLVFVFVALVIVLLYTQPCCCRFIKIWVHLWKIKTLQLKAFTLIEMLEWSYWSSIVLLLFFAPNLTKQRYRKEAVKCSRCQGGQPGWIVWTQSYQWPNPLAKLMEMYQQTAESYRAYAKNSGETCRLQIDLHLSGDPSDLDDRQLYLGLSGSIKTSFQQVEEKFFLEFEHLSRKPEAGIGKANGRWMLEVTARKIQTLPGSGDSPVLSFCKDHKTIRLDRAGGNSSWPMFTFRHREVVTYPLALEMGKLKHPFPLVFSPILSCLGFICRDYDLIVRGSRRSRRSD